jgi:hypothetical protein
VPPRSGNSPFDLGATIRDVFGIVASAATIIVLAQQIKLKKFGFGRLAISEKDLLDPEMVIQREKIDGSAGKNKCPRYLIRTFDRFEERSRPSQRQGGCGGAPEIARQAYLDTYCDT